MEKKNKKKKRNWLIEIAPFVIGGVGGYLGAMYGWFPSLRFETLASVLWQIANYIVAIILACLIQMAIHEAGHLVFGLLSGYKFCSYRIYSLMWYKRDGKLRFGRYSLAGTGGQCLMAPPELVDGKMPVILYNLGGSLLNLISSVLFLLLRIPLASVPMLSALLGTLALFGLLFGVLNGIPMRNNLICNDGMNALSLGKNPAAIRALWLQLKINQKTTEGLRLQDMPAEWFTMPTEAEMKDPLVASIGVFHCNRLLDEQRFTEADAAIRYMQAQDGTLGLYQNLLIFDRIYIELIGENRKEAIEALLAKLQKRFVKSMSNFTSVIRTEYALAKLHSRDEAKAAQLLARFEKIAKSFPYPGEIESEWELMENVDHAKERSTPDPRPAE